MSPGNPERNRASKEPGIVPTAAAIKDLQNYETGKTKDQEDAEVKALHERMAGGTGTGPLPQVGVFKAPSAMADPAPRSATASARSSTSAGFGRGGFSRAKRLTVADRHRERIRQSREAQASSSAAATSPVIENKTGSAASSSAAAMNPIDQDANQSAASSTGGAKYKNIQDDSSGVPRDKVYPKVKAAASTQGKKSAVEDGVLESPAYEPWTGVSGDVETTGGSAREEANARQVTTVKDLLAAPEPEKPPMNDSSNAEASGGVRRGDVEKAIRSTLGDVTMDVDRGAGPSAGPKRKRQLEDSSSALSEPDDDDSDPEDTSDEEGEGDGINVIHLSAGDINNIKYGDNYDLINLYVPREGAVEHYHVDMQHRHVTEARTGKHVGELEDMFPEANEDLSQALQFRNERDPENTIDYVFVDPHTPGKEGKIQFLFPEAHAKDPVLGVLDLSMLFVVFTDLDNNNKIGAKIYPGIENGFDFENAQHIRALTRWRRQIRIRKAGLVKFGKGLNWEWTKAEHKYLMHVMAHIVEFHRRAKEKKIIDRLDYRAIEKKMDAHFSRNVQLKEAPLAHEACDLPDQPAEGGKKIAVRQKLRSDRKAFIHTIEDIRVRVEACWNQINKFKTNDEALKEDWAKFVKPVAQKKQAKPVDKSCICGRDYTSTDMNREKLEKIKAATGKGKSGNKLKTPTGGKTKRGSKIEEAEDEEEEENLSDNLDADEEPAEADDNVDDDDEEESPRPAKRRKTVTPRTKTATRSSSTSESPSIAKRSSRASGKQPIKYRN